MSHVRRDSVSGRGSDRALARSRIPRPESVRQTTLPTGPGAAAREQGLQKILEGMHLLEISSPEELQEAVSEAQRESPPLSPRRAGGVRVNENRICIYDLETTGLGKTEEIGIVEVGALVAGYTDAWGWREIATFHSLCVPKTKVDNGVPHTHTVESLRSSGKKPFEEKAKKDFEKFLKEQKVTVLVAHNGKRYDHRIMAFHGFKPAVGTRAADSIVSFAQCSGWKIPKTDFSCEKRPGSKWPSLHSQATLSSICIRFEPAAAFQRRITLFPIVTGFWTL